MRSKIPTQYSRNLLSLIFGILLLAGLSSCEKDTFLPTTNPIVNELPGAAQVSSIADDYFSQEFVSPSLKKDLSRYFASNEKMDGDLTALISSTIKKPAIIFDDEQNNQKVITFHLEVDDKSILYNLVFIISEDKIKTGYLYAYELGEDFGRKLNLKETRIEDFLGTVRVNPASSVKNIFQKDGLGDCFTAGVVNTVLNTGSGGGGGGSSGGTGGTIAGNTGGSNTGTGGTPDRGDLEYCYRTRVGEITGHVYLVLVDCLTGETIRDGDILVLHDDDSDANSTDKSIDKADCDELIKLLGINTGVINPNFNRNQDQRWVSLMSGTPFAENTIAQLIIDLDVLASCSMGATACARVQLQAAATQMLGDYVASLNLDGPQISAVPAGLTDAQLMQVTETLYIAYLNDNASMFEGVRFVLQHRNNPYVSNLFNSVITQASILHQFDSENYAANAAAYLTVLNKTQGLMTETTTTWLMMHPEVLQRLSLPDITALAAKETAEVYVNLYQTDADFQMMADAYATGFPTFLIPVMKEVAFEVAISLIKKHLPGFSDFHNILDAINNARQGDVLGLMGEVLDIIKRKVPILAAIDLGIDAYQLFNKVSPVVQAFNRFEQYNTRTVTALLETIKEKYGSVLGRMDIGNPLEGILMRNAGDAREFFDLLITKFEGVTGPFTNPVNGNITYKFFSDTMNITFQPTSGTTGRPSIAFGLTRNSSLNVKLRF